MRAIHLFNSNGNEGDSWQGINKFTAMTYEERQRFLTTLFTDKKPTTPQRKLLQKKNRGSSTGLPTKFDWRSLGKVTPVKDQYVSADCCMLLAGQYRLADSTLTVPNLLIIHVLQCGSCWAYSSIANLESAVLIQRGTTFAATGLNLSEIQALECALPPDWDGCNGGYADSLLTYAVK